MPRLRRTNPGQPGYTRRRAGRGWAYLDQDRNLITDRALRRRIDALVIPPAWRDVWITPFANGHLQAVGTDDAGRRQYLYHPDWSANRGRVKFARVLELGEALPKARTIVTEQLSESTLSRERVLATAFRMLDRGHFRIGNEAYADKYGSYGLSTLLREHVRRQKGALTFEYIAKSGLHRVEQIDDPVLLDAVGALLRRRGGDIPELLAYRDGRSWRRVTGADINAYVKEVLRLEASAKDFRTWHGTVLGSVAVAEEYHRHPPGKSWTKKAFNAAVRRSIVAVSENLGNTPAVARGSYVHPGVIEKFQEGETIEDAVARLRRQQAEVAADDERYPVYLNAIAAAPTVERAVIKLLAD